MPLASPLYKYIDILIDYYLVIIIHIYVHKIYVCTKSMVFPKTTSLLFKCQALTHYNVNMSSDDPKPTWTIIACLDNYYKKYVLITK